MRLFLIAIILATILFSGCSTNPPQTYFDAAVYWSAPVEGAGVEKYQIEMNTGKDITIYFSSNTFFFLDLPHNTPCFTRVKSIGFDGSESEYSSYSDIFLVKKP